MRATKDSRRDYAVEFITPIVNLLLYKRDGSLIHCFVRIRECDIVLENQIYYLIVGLSSTRFYLAFLRSDV